MRGTEIKPEVRRVVLERDSANGCPCCIYCGRPLLRGGHLHHVVSRGAGGQGTEKNLVTLCPTCHSSLHKGNSDIKEYCKAYLDHIYGK